MKPLTSAFLAASLAASLFAADEPKEGWHFQIGDGVKEPEEKIDLEKESEKSLLMKILIESKKQTELQQEILKVLQKTFDPQPEYIVGDDGERCIANSSAKCFKMPVIGDALRVPVLRAYVENPNIETATEYKKWEARLLNQSFDAGVAGVLAIQQGGVSTYPIGYKNTDRTTIAGAEQTRATEKLNKIVRENGKYVVFLGLNLDVDMYSVNGVTQLAKRVGADKVSIVFANKKTMALYEESARMIIGMQKQWDGLASKSVNKSLFEEYGIYTTPQIVYEYQDPKNSKEIKRQTVSTGGASTGVMVERAFGLLAMEGIVSRGELAQYKADELSANGVESTKDLFLRRYDLILDPGKLKIEEEKTDEK
jgi:hypothetical protein